jgi:hypothetical protein
MPKGKTSQGWLDVVFGSKVKHGILKKGVYLRRANADGRLIGGWPNMLGLRIKGQKRRHTIRCIVSLLYKPAV